MKQKKTKVRNSLFVMLAVLLLATITAGPVSAAWTTEPVVLDSSLGTHERSEIAVDSAGNPHIVFAVERVGHGTYMRLRYAYLNDNFWMVQDLPAISPVGMTLSEFTFSLALDSNDNPHITYYTGNAIIHLTPDGNGAWTGSEVVNVVDFAQQNVKLTQVHDLAVIADDSAVDILHVAYVLSNYIPPGGDDPGVYILGKSYNQLWQPDFVTLLAGPFDPPTFNTSVSNLTIAANSLDVAILGTAHTRVTLNTGISYFSSLLHWDTRSGPTVVVGPVKLDLPLDFASSLALDSDSDSHISYVTTADNSLYHGENDDGFTSTRVYDGSATGILALGTVTDIAMDGNNPYIAFIQPIGEFGYVMKYAYLNGSSWITESIPSDSTFGGQQGMPSLGLDLRTPGAPVAHISHQYYFPGGFHIPGGNAMGHTTNDPAGAPDGDEDNIPDAIDNCPYVNNPDQLDEDGDKVGNACDVSQAYLDPDQSDKDGDGIGDPEDPCPNGDTDPFCLEGYPITTIPPGGVLDYYRFGDPLVWEVCRQNNTATYINTIFDCFSVHADIEVIVDGHPPTPVSPIYLLRRPYILGELNKCEGDPPPPEGCEADPYPLEDFTDDITLIPPFVPDLPGTIISDAAVNPHCITCDFSDRYNFPEPEAGGSVTVRVKEICHVNYILDPEDLIDINIGVHCTDESFEFPMVNPLVVEIDIKPGNGDDPNPINLGSKGKVPVAILSSETFDATTVDPATITLADAPIATKKGNPKKIKGASDNSMVSFEDIDGDGRMDLMVHILTSGLALSEADVTVMLKGRTFDGQYFEATDSVRVVQ